MRDRTAYEYQLYLRSIVHQMKQRLDKYLEPYDITNQQGRIVGFIAQRQAGGVCVSQKDIEGSMGLKGSSITSLLQGLERKGFIQRATSASDERVKEVSLTPKGQMLNSKFDNVFWETEKQILSGMTKDQEKCFWNC